MAQLTHEQYDALERAVVKGMRVVDSASGRRENVFVPLALALETGAKSIEARNPTTGLDLTIYLDEIDSFEVVGESTSRGACRNGARPFLCWRSTPTSHVWATAGREVTPVGRQESSSMYTPSPGNLARWDYWMSEPGTTNNRMALRSVIEAFRGISRKGARFRVTFTSDSQYLVKGMSEWVFGWKARGWKRKKVRYSTSSCGWRPSKRRVGTSVVEVGARARRTSAERVREFSGGARCEEQTTSNGIVASKFDEWLAAEREKGRMAMEPQSFPDGRFRRSFPKPIITGDL